MADDLSAKLEALTRTFSAALVQMIRTARLDDFAREGTARRTPVEASDLPRRRKRLPGEPPRKAGRPPGSPALEKVVALVLQRPDGVQPYELRAAMEPINKSQLSHLLRRAIDRGRVVKRGNAYFAA